MIEQSEPSYLEQVGAYLFQQPHVRNNTLRYTSLVPVLGAGLQGLRDLADSMLVSATLLINRLFHLHLVTYQVLPWESATCQVLLKALGGTAVNLK